MSPTPNDNPNDHPNRSQGPSDAADAATEAAVRRTLADAAPTDTHLDAGLADLHDRLGGGTAVAPAAALPSRRLAPRRVLGIAAVLLAIAGIGALLVARDDGPAKVITQEHDPAATGWYIPKGLSDEWKPTAVHIDSVRTADPGPSCPCQGLVWTDAPPFGSPDADSAAPTASIVLSQTRPGDPETGSPTDGIPSEQLIDDVDLGGGITATGYKVIAMEDGRERTDTVLAWEEGGGRSVLFGHGLSEQRTADAARAIVASDDVEAPPLEGFKLVDHVEYGTEAPSGVRVSVILTNTRTGAVVGYVLAESGSATVNTEVAPAVIDLPGAVGRMLRTEVRPATDGDPAYVSYLARWAGADVATGPEVVTGGADPGAATDATVRAVLSSLRPATAAEWAAFLDSAPVEIDGAAALKRPKLADVEESAGSGTSQGEGGGTTPTTTSPTDTTGTTGTTGTSFEGQGTPIPSNGITAEDLTLSPVLEVTTCGADPGMSNVVQSVDGTTCYLVGDAVADGTDLHQAVASFQESWVVAVEARPEAVDRLNALFDACYDAADSCPSQNTDGRGAVAIVLDGTVISAPAVNAPGIASDAFVISADFTEQQADDLAAAINAG